MLKTRIITSVVSLAIIGVVLFAIPPYFAEIFIGALIVAGAWEWSGFLVSPSTSSRSVFTGLIAVAVVLLPSLGPAVIIMVLGVACLWWFAAFLWTLRFPTPIPQALRWVCGFLVLVPLYLALLVLFRMGPWHLLAVMLIVWAADAGAYFAGKQFGRVKLAPSISPGKTWEGVIGGLLLVALVALTAGSYLGLKVAVLVPFCLAVAAISIVGDLTVSMFKRTVGLKDSGTLFPGHGGVLDRIDSVAAAAPFFVLGLTALGMTA